MSTVNATPAENLDRFLPIANQDGTPTQFFMDFLQRRGLTQNGVTLNINTIAANVAALQARRINTTSPILGGGDLSADRTLSHATSGVAAGAYTNANITVDANGHVTIAANGTNGTVTTTGTPAANKMAKFTGVSSIGNSLVNDDGNNVSMPAGTTAMTNGFFYIPAAAGPPTGTPPSISGTVPMYYDTTNNNFYVYNGAWKKVLLS